MSSTIKSLLTAEAAEMTLFCKGEEIQTKEGGGEIIFLNFSSEQCLGTRLRKKKLSITQRCAGLQWHRWPVREEPFSISEPQEVSLCASLCIRPERRGVVGLEVSLVPFPASYKDLSWPLPLVSWWALNWGIALGSRFSQSASTVPCSQEHLWEKLNLCVCKHQRGRCYCQAVEVILTYHPTASS